MTQAVARLRAAQTVAAGYQGGVLERAKRLLDASQTGFQEGQTSIVAVLEARRTYAAVQTEYLNALTSAALSRAELGTRGGSCTLLPFCPLRLSAKGDKMNTLPANKLNKSSLPLLLCGVRGRDRRNGCRDDTPAACPASRRTRCRSKERRNARRFRPDQTQRRSHENGGAARGNGTPCCRWGKA